MTRPTDTLAYVGEPLQAAAFRLAGFAVRTPVAGHEAEAVRTALGTAQAVFISREVAARLPPSMLAAALEARAPLTAIVPDQSPNPLDPAERVRAQLGVER